MRIKVCTCFSFPAVVAFFCHDGGCKGVGRADVC